MRQLYDMQQGARKGVWSELMKPVVEKLTNDDMLAIAAYTASLAPLKRRSHDDCVDSNESPKNRSSSRHRAVVDGLTSAAVHRLSGQT